MKQGWEYKKLGEVASFFRGLTYSGKDEVSFSNNIVLRSNNIDLNTNTIIFDELKFISDSIIIPKDKKLKKNSIFMCMSNGSKLHLGKVAFIDKEYPYAFGGFMGLIVPKEDELMPKMAYYYFCSQKFKTYLSSIGNGANINNIKFVDIAKDTIPIPPKSTQLSIVSELDKINELIRLKKEQLKDYENLAQSIFYEMFGDPVGNEKGWEVKKLGEVCSVGTGSTPNRKNKEYYEHGIYPWVKSTEVCNLPIYSVEEFITEEALQNTNCGLYPKDSILMAMYGQGKTRGQVGLLKIEACTNQAVAAIVPSKKINSIFLYRHLMLMYEHIRDMARGGNQANLNLTIVRSIQILLPPLPLQHLFAQRIEQIERQKSAVQKSITDLETLLASRMQYWFE